MTVSVGRGKDALPHEQPTGQAPVSFVDRWRAFRDKLLTNQAFLRWASSFPLTRPIARRRSRELFDLCAGFVYSQVLSACVRLRVFELLAEQPRTAADLAERLSLPLKTTALLLDAAESLRLVEKRGAGRYGLGPLGAATLGAPGTAALIAHHAHFYADMADPIALLREQHGATRLGSYWPYAGSESPDRLAAADVAGYCELMTASQALVSNEIVAALPLGSHRCLLDVGGGEGAFIAAAARQDPRIKLILFDLPAVAERARARFAAAGLDQRAIAIGGDFLADRLPDGADIVTLIRVLHDHDDASVGAILRAVHNVLPPGGTLAIAEPLSGTRGAETIGAAYFAFYLLAMGSGRPRGFEELRVMMEAAGFSRIRLVPTANPLVTSLILASVGPSAARIC